MTFRREPSRTEVRNSFNNRANVELARKVFAIESWCSYDPYQAHTWALRLINGTPANGEEVATSLINFEYMTEGAKAAYAADRGKARQRCDAIYEVFAAWKAKHEKAAA
jgi:hypothetical protein